MKLNCSVTIKTLAGKDIPGEDDKPLTIAAILVNALTAQSVDDNGRPKQIPGAEKISRWKLAQRIYEAVLPVDLSIEEATKLKTLVDEIYGTLVYAQVAEAIEAAASQK